MRKITSNKWFYLGFFSLIFFLIIRKFSPEIRVDFQLNYSVPNAKIFVDDLNFDNKPELIFYKFDLPGMVGIKITDEKENVIDQWNIYENYVDGNTFMAHDYDHDGVKEIFLVTMRNDSLFLQGINYTYPDSLIVNDLFLDHRTVHGKKPPIWDIQNCEAEFVDYDRDGMDDIILHINAGYSIDPRRIYVISPAQRRVLYVSDNLGTVFVKLRAEDVDKDGQIDFFAEHHSAPGNIHDSSHYLLDDKKTYFFVLDRKFRPQFPPVPIGKAFSGSYEYFQKSDLNPSFLCVSNPRDTTNDLPVLYIFSVYGEEISRIEFNHNDRIRIFPSSRADDFFLHNLRTGQIYQILPPLKLIPIKKSDNLRNANFLESFQFGGKNYYIFYKNDVVYFFTEDFDLILSVKSFPINPVHKTFTLENGNYKRIFFTDIRMNRTYEIRINQHFLSKIKWLIPLIIFSILFILESFITRVTGDVLFHSYIMQNQSLIQGRLQILISNNGKIWAWKISPDFPLQLSLRRNKNILTVFRDYPSILYFINRHLDSRNVIRKNLFIQKNLAYRLVNITLIPTYFLNRWPIAIFLCIEFSDNQFTPEPSQSQIYSGIFKMILDKFQILNSFVYKQLLDLEGLLNFENNSSTLQRNKLTHFKTELIRQLNDMQLFLENFDVQNLQFTNVLLTSILVKITELFRESYPEIEIEIQHFHMDHEVILIRENFEYLIIQILETITGYYPDIRKIYIGSSYIVTENQNDDAVELEIFPIFETGMESATINTEGFEQKNIIIRFLAMQQNIQLIIEDYPINPTYKLILHTK